MRVRQIMLPQQILPIIVPVRRAHHAMNVLLRRRIGVLRKPRQIGRPLVVELNQNHRTLNPVIENTVPCGVCKGRKAVDVASKPNSPPPKSTVLGLYQLNLYSRPVEFRLPTCYLHPCRTKINPKSSPPPAKSGNFPPPQASPHVSQAQFSTHEWVFAFHSSPVTRHLSLLF